MQFETLQKNFFYNPDDEKEYLLLKKKNMSLSLSLIVPFLFWITKCPNLTTYSNFPLKWTPISTGEHENTLQKSNIEISIEIWWQDYFTHFEMNFKIYLKNLKIQYDHLLLLWLKWWHRIFCFFICRLVLSILSVLNGEMNYWSCGFLSNTLNLIDLSLLSRFYIFYRLK